MSTQKKDTSNKVLIGVGILIVVVVVLVLLFTGGSSTGKVVQDINVVKIPLKDISSKAVFYEDEGSKYFVVKASDGSIKVAFDACDVCGGTKGYHQEGNDMICNNCGRYFAINFLGEKNLNGGGCWPSYLSQEIGGDYVVIDKSELKAGSFRF